MKDMTPPEKAIKATKAGVEAAGELALPTVEPDRGMRHEFDQQIKRLEGIITSEAEARIEEAKETARLRRAVVKWSRRTYLVVCGFIGLVILLSIAGAVAYDRIDGIAKENRRLALANIETQALAARRARGVIREACKSQNRDRGKLRIILKRGERTIPALVREGTFTQAQADRALESSRLARRDLSNEDCSSRAARIPIPQVKVP
jgi:hypothetical protein